MRLEDIHLNVLFSNTDLMNWVLFSSLYVPVFDVNYYPYHILKCEYIQSANIVKDYAAHYDGKCFYVSPIEGNYISFVVVYWLQQGE